MIFHFSIAAHRPRHVAEVLAELWGGDALLFPPVSDDGWIVLAGDERRSAIEVYPIDVVLREREGDADAYGESTGQVGFTASHAAIATALSQDQVMAIAAREGWPAKYRKRGGMFGVVEVWIEGRQMMEFLTPVMQDEYLARCPPPTGARCSMRSARPGRPSPALERREASAGPAVRTLLHALATGSGRWVDPTAAA